MQFELYKLNGEELYLSEINRNNSSKRTKFSDYRTDYDSFFDYWKYVIEDEKRLEDFRLDRDTLHIKMIYFDWDCWRHEESTIKLDRKLLMDVNFMIMINSLVINFNKVKKDTSENIEFKKQRYLKEEKIEKVANECIRSYMQTGEVKNLYDLNGTVKHYVLDNKKRLASRFISRGLKKDLKEVALTVGVGACIFPFLGLNVLYLAPLIYFCASLGLDIISLKKGRANLDAYIKKVEELVSGNPSDETKKKQELQDTKDQFLDFILEDYKFMEANASWEFDDLRKSFNSLNAKFDILKTMEVTSFRAISKPDLLRALILLESEMYSRTQKRGFKSKKDVKFNLEQLMERLAYIGCQFEEIEDNYIEVAKNVLNRIWSLPYEGCESEILKILNIIIEYYAMGISGKEFLQKITDVDNQVTNMINEAFDIEDDSVAPISYSSGLENQKTL